MTLYEFMVDGALAGAEFSDPSWSTWRIIARLMDGDADKLNYEEQALALQLTGRTVLPTVAPREVYVGAGRRSGKSRFSALVSDWLAAAEYPQLADGETAVVAHVAPDRSQASIDLDYARGIIARSDLLRAELVNDTATALEFRHRTRLEVATASYRTVRGRTLAGAVVDESAFLRSDDSALPDQELARALRPALMTLNGLLLVISSPHRKVGLLHDAYRRYFANDSETRGIYIQATSRQLNPLLDEEVIEEAMREDPAAAVSEYLGHFRADLSSYIDDATVDAAIVRDRRMLPYSQGSRYVAFVDPSGGRHDAMTLAISHQETGGRLVLDKLVIEKPPFTPEDVVRRFAETLGSYSLARCSGDAYGAEWTVSAFAKCGITYMPAEKDKSGIYVETLPLFSQGLVELLDIPQLEMELRLLERRPRAGGRGDMVDHPPRASDDAINAAAGSLWLASLQTSGALNGSANNVTHSNGDYDPLSRDDHVTSNDQAEQERRLRAMPWAMRPTIYN